MRIAVGMLTAKRPRPTVGTTAKRWEETLGLPVCLFAEPTADCAGCTEDAVTRPYTVAPTLDGLTPGPDGQYGNFQNHVQALADMESATQPDWVLLVEDDALPCNRIGEFLQLVLPTLPTTCGLLSLYRPQLRGYAHGDDKILPITRQNLVGALAFVYRGRLCAADVLTRHGDLQRYGGSHRQRVEGCPPHERLSCDAWAGDYVRRAGHMPYVVHTSLVWHWSEPNNSSIGGGRAAGPRQAARVAPDAVAWFESFVH